MPHGWGSPTGTIVLNPYSRQVPGPIRAVILDLDGTLLDHSGAARAGLALWLGSLGLSLDEELETAWFDAEDRWHLAWMSGAVSPREQRRLRLRDFLPLIDHPTGSDAELDEVYAGFLQAYEASWFGFDDVEAGVAALERHGVLVAVLTNGAEDQQNAKVKALGLAGRVGRVFTAEGLGAAKPDPATYLAVCAHLGTAPEETLFIGDSYELDVLAPRRAGLQAVHLDRHDAGPHDEEHRLGSLKQLDNWLRQHDTIGS
jgi:putative hydrolase of the HAD superfamily